MAPPSTRVPVGRPRGAPGGGRASLASSMVGGIGSAGERALEPCLCHGMSSSSALCWLGCSREVGVPVMPLTPTYRCRLEWGLEMQILPLQVTFPTCPGPHS